ncbi:hypothetical protein ZWY2020_057099 [Hordeum vulgare]|nr:hypothetical protein ZWY2020_057099 [Hordeum vulgare]
MEPTVRDVLAFHRVDRAAYEHLLSLGAGRQPARDAVALLMWLHHSVGADAVASVRLEVRTPADAARLVSDALAVLHGVAWPRPQRQGAGMPRVCAGCGGVVAADARPFLAGLVPGGGADPRARRGVAEVLRGVGSLVFDDRLQALLRRHEKEGGAVPAELAAPYRPGDGEGDEEDEGGRSLFITFSKGFPLTREEINAYFTERWGEGCVESVMIQREPPLGEAPRYGKVTFRQASVAEAVLGGDRRAKLLVNGRHLWARKYVPKPHHHN